MRPPPSTFRAARDTFRREVRAGGKDEYNLRVRAEAPSLRRQYAIVTAVFAGLLLASFALFAHLLVEQLSRSYMEDVLLSGQAQAEELARRMGGEDLPLYKVVETRREALAQISAALARQEVVESVQVFDDLGKLVYQTQIRTEGFVGGFPEGSYELVLPPAPDQVLETSRSYEIAVPLEDLGTVVVTVSKEALAGRVTLLRRQLLGHTILAGGGSLLVLLAALGFIAHLVQRNARLEQHRRVQAELAALGALAANLAHEIRNPLNALSLNLELLEEDLDRRDHPVDAVVLARREANRLTRLVGDFLNYARPALPAREEHAAGEMIREVATLLEPTCRRGGVSLEVDAPDILARFDRGQLSQVLLNLALNAVQALENQPVRQIRLTCREHMGRLILEVIDSGPGIPPEELAQVREAFYTRRKGGTGLGLAIADRIVNAHDGVLELENRTEGGLTARVAVPIIPEG
jgi:signal transduction histidine kinase